MTWEILYHHEVEADLESVGTAMARRIVRAIDQKLTRSPLEFGIPLSAGLADFRKLRVGDCRVVYQVLEWEVIVFVLAVGPRRDKEVYSCPRGIRGSATRPSASRRSLSPWTSSLHNCKPGKQL